MLGKIFGFKKIDMEEAKSTRKKLLESTSALHQKETFTASEDIISQEDEKIDILRKLSQNKSQLIEISDGNRIDIIEFNETGEVTGTNTVKKEALVENKEQHKTFRVKKNDEGKWEITEKDELSKAEVSTTLSGGYVYKGKLEVPGKKKLTVLFWGNGSGNLEPLVIRKLLDLEKLGSTEDINIIAQISRAPQEEIRENFTSFGIDEKTIDKLGSYIIDREKLKSLESLQGNVYSQIGLTEELKKLSFNEEEIKIVLNYSENCEFIQSNIDGNWSKQARRYYVTKGQEEPGNLPVVKNETVDSPVLENLGNINMTDRKELQEFLITEMKQFPAEHYMIVLFDHGKGWKGIAPEKEDHGNISPEDMGDITKKVKETTGQNIDVMVMENCLEGQAEALYPMKDSTDYMIASPEILWGSAFTDNPGPIHIREGLEIIQKNEKNELNNPREAAFAIVQATANKHHAITLSVIDSKKLDELAESTANLKEAIKNSELTQEELRHIAAKTQQYELLDSPETKHGFVDIGDLAENIEAETDNEEVKKATKGLKDALNHTVLGKLAMSGDEIACRSDDGDGFTVFEGNVKRCHGLSINLGIEQSDIERKTYESLSFIKKTGWNEIVHRAGWKPGATATSNNAS